MSLGAVFAAALALWAGVVALLWRLLVMSQRAGAAARDTASALDTARRLSAAAQAASQAGTDPASPEEILRRGDGIWDKERPR